MKGMPTMLLRLVLIACTLVALSPLRVTAQVLAGSTFWFDHGVEDAADTERYELCVDTVTATTCTTIGVVRVGTTNTYRFTLPSSVPRGNRALSVRAIGVLDTGASGPSNVVSVRVVGKPGQPTLLRMTEAQ